MVTKENALKYRHFSENPEHELRKDTGGEAERDKNKRRKSGAMTRSVLWPTLAASFTLPCSTSPPKVVVQGCALESQPLYGAP